MAELEERKRQILRAMILEYVAAAEPVGSELLASKYGFGVRSATIRNELADLVEQGYLEQPHKSAGRIPSDLGYRYYVDELGEWVNLGAKTRNVVKTATDEREALKELLTDTARVLSQLTQLMSAASIVPDGQLKVRHAVITALGPERLLFVLVLNNGHVINRLVESSQNLTLTEIGRANAVLAKCVEGTSLDALARMKVPTTGESPALDRLITSVIQLASLAAREVDRHELIVEGEEFLLNQPEIRRNIDLFNHLYKTLETRAGVKELFEFAGDEQQSITIGREHGAETLAPFAILRQRFFAGENEAGMIAVIGPTRMNYDASRSLLDFTAKAISDTLTKLMK